MAAQEQGKDSEFNWAALFIRSLDDQVGKLSELSLNLEYYDYNIRKYNYEIASVIITNLLIKLWGHLTPKEQEHGRELKDKLDKAVKMLPIFEIKTSSGLGMHQQQKVFNQNNYEVINTIIFEFQLEIVQWIESHKLGTPARKDPTKAVIDF